MFMKYIAIIEMPRGTNRRIHLAYDKSGFVDLGPIVDQVPVNEGVMPVHYGYIEGTKNETEGDEVDVIVFSKNSYKTGDRVEVEILGSLVRKDGDHKIIAHDSSESNLVFKNLSEAEQKIIVDFMGYKSPIISIDSKEQAEEYVQLNKTKWK
jgi:inorganic pyrophosphatase